MNFLKIKSAIRNSIPASIKKFVAYSEDMEYGTVSFSQYGEDLVLDQLLKDKEKGVYVDVGAHHPFRFSNTRLFYKKGWSGLNIDPAPGFKKLFDQYRPLDVNIEVGVGDKEGYFDYFIADHPAMNSLYQPGPNGIKTQIQVLRLETILEKNIHENTQIDFLSIDAEGYDLKILKSNNWAKYKPRFVVVEDKEYSFENITKGEIYKYLITKGYKLVAGTFISFIYVLD